MKEIFPGDIVQYPVQWFFIDLRKIRVSDLYNKSNWSKKNHSFTTW